MDEQPQPEPEHEFKDVRLMIAIPSQADWDCEFGLSLALMVQHLTWHLIKFHIQNERGSILPQLRQNLVDHAINGGATHLLFLDSDQVFPPELPIKWIRADRPVVACNIATKGMPSYPTAKNFKRGKLTPHYSDLANERYSTVDRVGTGIMLLRADALAALPRPAFLPYWNANLDHYVGEDWAMVEHLEKAGIPIVVDNLASRVTYHAGRLAFGEEHLVATRKATANDKGPDNQPSIIALGQA